MRDTAYQISPLTYHRQRLTFVAMLRMSQLNPVNQLYPPLSTNGRHPFAKKLPIGDSDLWKMALVGKYALALGNADA